MNCALHCCWELLALGWGPLLCNCDVLTVVYVREVESHGAREK